MTLGLWGYSEEWSLISRHVPQASPQLKLQDTFWANREGGSKGDMCVDLPQPVHWDLSDM